MVRLERVPIFLPGLLRIRRDQTKVAKANPRARWLGLQKPISRGRSDSCACVSNPTNAHWVIHANLHTPVHIQLEMAKHVAKHMVRCSIRAHPTDMRIHPGPQGNAQSRISQQQFNHQQILSRMRTLFHQFHRLWFNLRFFLCSPRRLVCLPI